MSIFAWQLSAVNSVAPVGSLAPTSGHPLRRRRTYSVLSAPAIMELKPALQVHPYLFFTPLPLLPNRSLTRGGLNPYPVSTGDPDMSDLIFIALGSATLLVLALYARALDRL